MDLLEIIRTRGSTRAFRDEPVPRELLEQVLCDASRAPSSLNIQPWEVHIVLGEERKRLSRQLMRSYRERGVTCGPGTVRPLPDRFIMRARECAERMTPLVEQMGEDFKTYINEGSLNFYGAPATALIFMDECFPPERMTDLGCFIAFLLLAAAGHGLASCPIGLVKAYEEVVKEHLNVSESKSLVLSVALGFADHAAAVNTFRSPRAELREFVRWID